MLIYHPVGTARMSDTHEEAVVDSQLRVHGLQGLRVIDASIMPLIPGGNTNAPTIMIAERGADLIRGRVAQATAPSSGSGMSAGHARARWLDRRPRRSSPCRRTARSTTTARASGPPLVLLHGIGLRWQINAARDRPARGATST